MHRIGNSYDKLQHSLNNLQLNNHLPSVLSTISTTVSEIQNAAQ